MKYLRILLLLGIAIISLATEVAQAASEDVFLGQIQPPSEQTMGQGQSALWALHDVATQYQPSQPTPAMQAAMQAQHEGRFLDALILLDEAGKSGQAGADAEDEMSLLRASFLLQGNQSQQALKILAPLLGKTRHAADAYALTAMAHLQQRQMREALDAANHAHDLGDGILPHLALSYALQGLGRLAEASVVIHGLNTQTPPSAIALAREAELALTLDQVQSAKVLVKQAQGVEAAHPYVIAVSGLVYLIDGQARDAKAAFETALQRDSKDAKALLGLGLAETKLGNFQTGQKKLQAANEADPGNALILTYLGRAQQQSGQTEATKESWHSAQQADPKDPTPWLYQAQAELQANRPLDARESLREAQSRSAYRQVYRGEYLLREDEQLLQANLAEIQRRLGLDSLAFHTLSDSASEKNAANLRNQAGLLQGQRFAESARRSLLLQSLFNERPGNLPAALDVYSDGLGQANTSSPEHGVVSGLNSQQASYNNYDELFSRRTMLEADATSGSKKTNGEQIRLGVGNDTLGLGIAQLQFKTDGFASFENLDNSVWQSTVQWRPTLSTQAFVSYQTFKSQHGEVISPGSAAIISDAITENNQVTRLGLRHTLTESSELRALWSSQLTDHTDNYNGVPAPWNVQRNSGSAHSVELQYRHSGAAYATQWGVQQTRGQFNIGLPSSPPSTDRTQNAQKLYAAWQQTLNPHWQLDAGLGFGKVDVQDNLKTPRDYSTSLARWLPQLGAVYTPDTGTHVRLAAWQDVETLKLGDASLAPVSLAGILLARPGDSGQWVHAISLGADKQLNPAWLLDAQTQRHKRDYPSIDSNTNQQYLIGQKIDESRLALHWQPQESPWAVSLSCDYERIQNDPQTMQNDSVNEQRLRQQQLDIRWFASQRLTADLKWSHNQIGGTHNVFDSSYNVIYPDYQDSFNQLDADLIWQFNKSDSLTAGVLNAFDKRFQYGDIDMLNPRFSKGRLVYGKLKLAW